MKGGRWVLRNHKVLIFLLAVIWLTVIFLWFSIAYDYFT